MLYFISILLAGPVMMYAFDGLLYLSDLRKLPAKEEIFVSGLALVTLVPGWLFGSRLKLPRRFDARYLPLILMPFLCILLPWFFLYFSGEAYLAVQAVMEKNVMQGRLLGTPPQEEHPELDFLFADDHDLPIGPPQKISLKGGFIRVKACYRNRIDALGYDFYWNAMQRFPTGEIRLLAVNGITPTQESISSGSYPFSLPVVMLANASLTPEAKALHDWLISPEGQALIAKTGYAPLTTAEVP